jgi:3-dehydroquinate synthetase
MDLPSIMIKMAVDKKNIGSSIRCTLITGMGKCMPDAMPVPHADIEAVVSAHL